MDQHKGAHDPHRAGPVQPCGKLFTGPRAPRRTRHEPAGRADPVQLFSVRDGKIVSLVIIYNKPFDY
jgi:hypothetical protein